MKSEGTAYGTLLVGTADELFRKAVEMLLTEASKRSMATIGLPGGITPHKWFQWLIENRTLDTYALDRICWLTSDERYVPLDSDQSNFGNAARLFLDPLEVPETRRMPWPTQVDPYSASIVFNHRWNERFGDSRCFDLCFLGLGNDGHMASIFPDSPLRGMESKANFSSVDVPGKGWRLTITEQGLNRCGKILLMVMGDKKAAPLKAVFKDSFNPSRQPAHLLRDISDNVTWLLDEEAAAGLNI
ncbi:MAG: 6-phosphogluconolactonase [Opitutales bacterium]